MKHIPHTPEGRGGVLHPAHHKAAPSITLQTPSSLGGFFLTFLRWFHEGPAFAKLFGETIPLVDTL